MVRHNDSCYQAVLISLISFYIERLNATSHGPYQCIIDGSKRKCFSLSSHLSRYNPSQMYYYNN